MFLGILSGHLDVFFLNCLSTCMLGKAVCFPGQFCNVVFSL